ncbi:MAG TPA: hypothetical protein VGQ26_14550 [Streptosporangiaceae bacterium]|nr:hypothetical protein [Streptosporangiaceae bacterium]
MTGRSNARARRSVPGTSPAAQPRQATYAPVLPGVLACSRCGALLLDATAARAAHDRFHEGLRQLWHNGGRP